MASAAKAHYLQFDTQWASLALLYYDYVLTFPAEVEHIWKAGRFRLSTILYVFCRYALPANVLYLLAISNKLGDQVRCDVWYKIIGAISVIGRAAVITVFIMRTYAVCARSSFVLYGLGAIGVTCTYQDCGVMDHQVFQSNTLLSILVCVFESIATGLTIFRSVQALRVRAPGKARKSSFSYLVLEQGVLYFGFVSLFTVTAVILNFRAAAGTFFQRLPNAITLPLSGMLTARFLLHLRAWDCKPVIGSASHTMHDAEGTMPTFQVAQRAMTSIVDEFGSDPVQNAAESQDRDSDEHELSEIAVEERHSYEM